MMTWSNTKYKTTKKVYLKFNSKVFTLLLKSKQSLPFDFYFFSGQFFYWPKNDKKDLLKSTFNRFLSHEKNALVLVFLNSFSFSLPFLWKQGEGWEKGEEKKG